MQRHIFCENSHGKVSLAKFFLTVKAIFRKRGKCFIVSGGWTPLGLPQVYACGSGALAKKGEHHSHATLCLRFTFFLSLIENQSVNRLLHGVAAVIQSYFFLSHHFSGTKRGHAVGIFVRKSFKLLIL